MSIIGEPEYTYDNNGNLTSDTEFCYFYNDANKLYKVEHCSDDTLLAEYIYDSAGQRIVKKLYDHGTFEKLVIDVGDVYDFTINANLSEEWNMYYRANNELIAKKDNTGTVTYHHNDHLGSASIVTTGTGALLEETRYYPYGELRDGGSESNTGKYQFTGQENDFETGLSYYGARYYSSEIGRFVQPDSMLPNIYDPQQLNRYVYVRNNPMKYTDPTGHELYFINVGIGGSLTSIITLGLTGSKNYSIGAACNNQGKCAVVVTKDSSLGGGGGGDLSATIDGTVSIGVVMGTNSLDDLNGKDGGIRGSGNGELGVGGVDIGVGLSEPLEQAGNPNSPIQAVDISLTGGIGPGIGGSLTLEGTQSESKVVTKSPPVSDNATVRTREVLPDGSVRIKDGNGKVIGYENNTRAQSMPANRKETVKLNTKDPGCGKIKSC